MSAQPGHNAVLGLQGFQPTTMQPEMRASAPPPPVQAAEPSGEHTVTLTAEQVDIINHAICHTYFFDGYDMAGPDGPAANELLMALGFHDRRAESEDARFRCSACGRVGSADDGCADGEPCPDEDCDGTCSLVID